MNHTHVPFWFSEQFVYKNPIQFENLTRHKITFISQKVYQKDTRFSYFLNISVLRHEVAYFDCSAKVLSLCLNPASRRCDSMEACAQGAFLMGMKPF
jgi:hypothetical protein